MKEFKYDSVQTKGSFSPGLPLVAFLCFSISHRTPSHASYSASRIPMALSRLSTDLGTTKG